ncbi:MAG TPA: amidase domain-containing protein [Pseudonocardiaceae bacterium]|nr:amidase domain-containing protein [Pseudonocardiaceae bacterium]
MAISVSQLASASTVAWNEAGDQWAWLMQLTEEASGDLEEDSEHLSTAWSDVVGQLAVGSIKDLYNRFNVATDVMSSIVNVMDALATAVGAAQTVLQDAMSTAEQNGYAVNEDGSVQVVDVPVLDVRFATDLRNEIQDALRSADEADQQAAKDLRALAAQVNQTNEDSELALQNSMSEDVLAIYTDMLPPKGTPPDQVAAWWQALTPGQQQDLEKAIPLSLYNLDGIPQAIKNQLAGPGPVNRMTMVQFAAGNWSNDDLNWVNANDNCTVFASDALAASGLPQTDDWSQAHLFFGLGPTSSVGSSPSWGLAQGLHDYLTETPPQPDGSSPIGKEVPPSEAKPGDLLFIQNGPGTQTNGGPGHIHHTAIVTAVLPNGDILYTQHTDDAQNLSIDGRIQHLHEAEGNEHAVIVQVGS